MHALPLVPRRNPRGQWQRWEPRLLMHFPSQPPLSTAHSSTSEVQRAPSVPKRESSLPNWQAHQCSQEKPISSQKTDSSVPTRELRQCPRKSLISAQQTGPLVPKRLITAQQTVPKAKARTVSNREFYHCPTDGIIRCPTNKPISNPKNHQCPVKKIPLVHRNQTIPLLFQARRLSQFF